MAAAGEQRGREYLERHRIPELLRSLCALLLYHRPEKPREFLIQVLERVMAGKRGEGEYPCLMDDSNLTAMFEMMDVVGQGYITAAQYREALRTLGLSTEGLQADDDVHITLDAFKEEV
ncbi:EF-hand calcium-binding domain-containing protein 10 [Dromaius novaehollandiae]|nr:EF-hand calcium-binding domain-containing protein 10 [Dromaius novaehollandiae]